MEKTPSDKPLRGERHFLMPNVIEVVFSHPCGGEPEHDPIIDDIPLGNVIDFPIKEDLPEDAA